MSSPPLQGADATGAARNVNDMGAVTNFDPKIAAALRQEDLGRAISYPDPTGETAIKNYAATMAKDFGRGIGRGSGIQLRVDGDLIPQPNGEMRRSKTPVRLDDALADVILIVMAQVADYEPTGRGNGYRAYLKENTPGIVSLFGDMHETEGSHQKHTNKKGHF